MPFHEISAESAYTPEQLFALVADVRSYPEFLPWVAGVRILEEGDGTMLAELLVRFKLFTDRYTSRVTLSPPSGPGGEGAVTAEAVSGPFHHLRNDWRFSPDPVSGGAKIHFTIDFAFRAKLLDRLIGSMFNRAMMKMTGAFESRARELYG